MGRLRVSCALLGCLLLAGCRHKVRPVVPVTSTAPIPVEKAPEPKNPPVIAQVPLTPAPLPAVQVPTKKKPRRKKPVAEPAAPPSSGGERGAGAGSRVGDWVADGGRGRCAGEAAAGERDAG